MSITEKFTGYVSNLMEPIKTAHAATDINGNWYCDLQEPDFEKSQYSRAIEFFNSDAQRYFQRNPTATMEEKGDHLIKKGLEDIGNQAACLKEGHGINPDSVATFDEPVRKVFEYNMDKLIDTAPTLVNYAKVPEFGEVAPLIVIGALGISLLFWKFYNKKLNYNLFNFKY